MKRKLIAAAAVIGVLAAGGAGAAVAVGGDEGVGSLSGPEADRAVDAALAVTGGGKANAVERDGERGATYEVEVRRPDGSTVDVRLDAGYKLVAVDSDSEQQDSDSGENESGG